ncbi:MAG: DMT family transporter [Geminicoccaceae bacterium]
MSPAAHGIDNLRGALWIVVSSGFFSAMQACAKLLGERLPSIEVAFGRAFLGFLIILPLLLLQSPGIWRTQRLWLHVTRGGMGTFALICSYYSIAHMPLAVATALSFTRPLFQVVLAALVLHEVVRRGRWAATAIGFVGVLIVLRPGTETFDLAALVALAGALAVAFVSLALRELAQGERHLTILAYLGVVGTVMTGVPTAFVWVTPTLHEVAITFLMACVGVAGQYCLMQGYRIGEASALAPYDYLRLPFTATLGLLLFAEIPDGHAMLGALVIAGSTFYMAWREARRSRSPEPA